MNKKSTLYRVISAAVSVLTVAASVPQIPSALAATQSSTLAGDVNCDRKVNLDDINLLQRYIMGKADISKQGFINADINKDKVLNANDISKIKQLVLNSSRNTTTAKTTAVTTTTTKATTTTTKKTTTTTTTTKKTTTTTTTTTVTPEAKSDEFITPPVSNMYGSLPSQGTAGMVVFYVDFPDCRYTYAPTTDHIYDIVFGGTDEENPCFPNESLRAYFSRASKGVMELQGNVFRYTAKNPVSYYENDSYKCQLINEVLDAFDAQTNYADYDGNYDGVIDSILISVPAETNDDNWWAAAGTYGGAPDKTVDGMRPGHIIIGNAEIDSYFGYRNFASTYTHEAAHCMGLPDYYLYDGDDTEGLHGSAGFELMDEVYSDLSAASKLMLGWYRENQIEVFTGDIPQKYVLRDAQSDDGNCIIIPYRSLDSEYKSEFIILEYTTLSGNNSAIPDEYWWKPQGSGIRAFHVDAEVDPADYWQMFKYDNSKTASLPAGENLKRFIRVINDTPSDNLFYEDGVLINSIRGFNFYDSNGLETVDPGVIVLVNELTDEGYNITIRRK